GGPNSVYDPDSFGIDEEILDLGIPILGICYGMQLVTHRLGGKVETANHREYGKAQINLGEQEAPLFSDTPLNQTVWMSHGDLVTQSPSGFEVVATSPSCPIAAIQNTEKIIYCVQFHPEVRHSEYGNLLLKNFALNICNCKGDWSMEN